MHREPCQGAHTHRRQAAMPPGMRWPSALLALLLAACVHSPQAAVPAAAGGQWTSAEPAACTQQVAQASDGLGAAARELAQQGMALEATCPGAGPGWVVRVRVVDGMKARKVVRGPLADGQVVDMGTPAGVLQPGAERSAQGYSPDVLYNREWLRTLMARHQWDGAAEAWWRFARRAPAAVPANAADTDLAAR
ncbi:D-Ala-D-Ala dipeptidase [Acidovorax sp. M2(2025)]|uniref:D-Ala-D-Ala dipeptidase n=1 Tax=Acidovorax sp. M2(2025) TaxID=3411355 RepID=UPI003BF5615A